MALDVQAVRKDFPILAREINGVPLVYLDSANSAQKPQCVIDAEADLYASHYANVARAVHTLGSEVTRAYEGARDKVAAFINARSRDEVVFTRNITEALNLLAYAFSNASTFRGAERFRLRAGDEILITEMEHHSNIVPWQLLAERTGATLRWIPIDDDGRLVDSAIDELITERTKVVSFVYQSNALGTINPVRRLVERAHSVGALAIVDAAQAAPHLPLDVQALGADFLAFTGHKLYGPTGVGVLWGRYELLAELPPFLGGGEMIETVTMERSTFAAPPHRFEAGTPMIAQAVALGTAVDYVSGLGMEDIREHEKAITAYALEGLQTVSGLTVVGPKEAVERGAAISFTVAGVHPHDVAQLLDESGVAVRAGHHCARPVHAHFGIPASTRASFGVYTTPEEIDALVRGVEKVKELFR
jgi:cysteine desulfurase/selenocysteine lyase